MWNYTGDRSVRFISVGHRIRSFQERFRDASNAVTPAAKRTDCDKREKEETGKLLWAIYLVVNLE